MEPHKLWIEQCEATYGIREKFGVEKALGYLIGEKLLYFVRASDSDPQFKEQLPHFLKGVKDIFLPHEIRGYLDTVRNTGSSAHVLEPEDLEFMREAGAFEEDPVQSAEDIMIVERLKALLL